MSSVLLVFSLSRFDDIQSFMSCRQLMSDSVGSWVDGRGKNFSPSPSPSPTRPEIRVGSGLKCQSLRSGRVGLGLLSR